MILFAMLANGENQNKDHTDNNRMEKIRAGDKKAFEDLFFEYHEQLSRFANSITKSREFARDAVQDVFLKIWRNRKKIDIRISIKVYLYQSVRNQSLNLLDRQKNQLKLRERYTTELRIVGGSEDYQSSLKLSEEEKELVRKIWIVVSQMPERRRLVFELHRKHGFSYKEIAKILDITRKTVENHMAQALQHIRANVRVN